MIRLPSIFSNGMVINKEARIWGWVEPRVAVSVIFLGKTYEAVSEEDGRFEIMIVSESYGGPHILTIGDIIIRDVYVGHVWLCAGQSNMEQPIARTRPLLDEHIKEAPQIRAFQAEKGMSFNGPAQDVKGCWKAATADFLKEIFAVPYFFAQALMGSADRNLSACEASVVPIGLINVAAGGTPVEAWLPEEVVRTFPSLYDKFLPHKQPGYSKALETESATQSHAWHNTLQANDRGLLENWHNLHYDHSQWEETMLLNQHIPSHGAIWYRKDIYLPEDIEQATLNLGRVVDSVSIYVNGEEVINISYQYPPCRCIIPNGCLKRGKNTITIRAVGEANKHHFIPGKPYELTHAKGTISLLGPWRWRTGYEMPPAKPSVWLYNIPCCIYNYMLAPILGYSIGGVIWYQGESNTSNPQTYKSLFEAFVQLLRRHFGEGLPIMFTQLANYIDPIGNGENWAQLRDQQKQCLTIPNTAMAVTIDCGEYNDLHPQDKKTVGDRLALWARRLVYGENIVSSGPVAREAVVQNGQMIINFAYGEGLWAKNGRPMVEIIDTSEKTHHLYGEIEGEALILRIGSINPKIIRFGWADYPTVILYNAHNLPAAPFALTLD